MMSIVAAQAIIGLLASVALVTFWFGPRRWIVTDRSRNQMFAAREEFFDEAASGRISFNDPSYRIVREAINGNIRFAHAVSIVRIVQHLWARKRHHADSAGPSVRAAASAITDPTVRRAAHRALNRVESTALRLLFFRSPILGVLLLISIFLLNVIRWRGHTGMWRALRGELQPYSDALQAEALTA